MNPIKVYTQSFKGLSKESWMLALVMLVNRSGSMMLPFLGVYMTDHLGFSLKDTGLILGCFGLGAVFGSWFGGFLTDKFGEFSVQSLSLLLSVPMFLLIPLFQTELGLGMMIFLQSCVSECFRPANSVAVTKYAKKENLTRAFSLNRLAVNLGFSIGPALGGILSTISYDFLFYSNAIGALLAGLLYVKFFGKYQHKVQNEINIQPNQKKSTSPYRDRKFIVFSLLCFVFSVLFFQLLNTLTLFYKQEAELTQSQIGLILGYSGFIIVLLEMILVQIAEKYFRLHTTLLVGATLCAISMGMLAFGHNIGYLIFAMTIFCVGEIWTLPFMSTVTAMRAGDHNKGAYMGLLGIGFSFSFIITPIVGTWVAEHYGFSTLWIGTFVIMMMAAVGFKLVVPWMFDGQNSN